MGKNIPTEIKDREIGNTSERDRAARVGPPPVYDAAGKKA
jgi:hypothetical protein